MAAAAGGARAAVVHRSSAAATPPVARAWEVDRDTILVAAPPSQALLVRTRHARLASIHPSRPPPRQGPRAAAPARSGPPRRQHPMRRSAQRQGAQCPRHRSVRPGRADAVVGGARRASWAAQPRMRSDCAAGGRAACMTMRRPPAAAPPDSVHSSSAAQRADEAPSARRRRGRALPTQRGRAPRARHARASRAGGPASRAPPRSCSACLQVPTRPWRKTRAASTVRMARTRHRRRQPLRPTPLRPPRCSREPPPRPRPMLAPEPAAGRTSRALRRWHRRFG